MNLNSSKRVRWSMKIHNNKGSILLYILGQCTPEYQLLENISRIVILTIILSSSSGGLDGSDVLFFFL